MSLRYIANTTQKSDSIESLIQLNGFDEVPLIDMI